MTTPKARFFNLARLSEVGSALVLAIWLTTAIASPAQTFTTLINFDGTNGANPDLMSLIQGTNGSFYGTTNGGGAYGNCTETVGCGTIFKITPGGTLTTLLSFDNTDGSGPAPGLVQTTNGYFYGVNSNGGDFGECFGLGCGTVFKITPTGTVTTLHSFDFADGANPNAPLVQATDGNFYGSTVNGGASSNCSDACGTVFKITPGGTLTTLHSFDFTDGRAPFGGLVQATNGYLYGTAVNGGATSNCSIGCGTVFKITPGGTLTTLHDFDGTDGAYPFAGLVQATDGDLYGTTFSGGASSNCSGGCGTVFKITPGGTLTTLHSFDFTDGAYPQAGLVQATDGDFYGTTSGNSSTGLTNYGTVFKITPGGTLTTLHSFDGTDGAYPYGGLFQATNGKFYGTTYQGGDLSCGGGYGCGTVFSLSVGLGPFVQTLPTSGKVGAKVIILGSNLTDTTSVTFNGAAATFTVVKSTQITATVPTGATTGTVEVTTPSGTLSSNVAFRVMP